MQSKLAYSHPYANLSARKPVKLPWLTLLDLTGLALAVLLVLLQLGDNVQAPQRLLFASLLAVFGLNARLTIGHFRSIETLLRKNHPSVLFVPVVTALSTLIIQALTRSYYSGTALLLFVAFWTVWILLSRVIYRQCTPPLKVLIISPESHSYELYGIPSVKVTSLTEPPEQLQRWDIVVINPTKAYSKEWLQWLAHADMLGIRTLSAPIVIETLTRRMPVGMLHGEWAYEIFHGRSLYHFWKRVIDIAVVLLMLPLLIPTMVILASVVLFDSGRPIFYRQERIGMHGKRFMMVKLRTMHNCAEAVTASFTEQNDPRITRVGRFLRKFRLDEIPQFWNVLKGDMSIIGPRPEQLAFAEQFGEEIPLYKLRHNVRPGITGWAQVKSGYAANANGTHDKLCYDLYYVKHCSPWLDAKVVLATVLTIMTGFGAR